MNEQDKYTSIPPTPPHFFSVVQATRNAFLFIIAERRYLARISAPVIFLQIALSISHFMINPDASIFEQFLWEMPATVFMGWFTFSLVRLIIFGEKLYNLPVSDVRFMQYRAHLMKITILLSILFKAALIVLAGISTAASNINPKEVMPPHFIFMGFALIVFIFWAMRFITIPLLAAVDYPLITFIKQAKGFAFSLRIIGVMIMCTFPAFFLLQLFVTAIISDPENITDIEFMFVLALHSPFAVIISAIVNSGLVFALKEMLGQSDTV